MNKDVPARPIPSDSSLLKELDYVGALKMKFALNDKHCYFYKELHGTTTHVLTLNKQGMEQLADEINGLSRRMK